MPNFRVTLVEKVVYGLDIEADTEEEASELAIEVMVQSEDINEFFMEVEDRSVTFIMEKP